MGITSSTKINTLYEYTKLSGASYHIQINDSQISAYTPGVSGVSSIFNWSTGNPKWSIQTFVDYAWLTNGAYWLRYGGGTAYFAQVGGATNNPNSEILGSTSGVAGFTTSTYVYRWAYQDGIGYIGPASSTYGFGSVPSLGLYQKNGFQNTNSAYGITNGVIWRTELLSGVALGTSAWSFPMTSGVFSVIDDGVTAGIRGGSLILDPGFNDGQVNFFNDIGAFPGFQEIYNNRMFYGGFKVTSMKSKFYVSEDANPELVFADSFFEVRTNDGDELTAFKSYDGQICIGKRYSFHAVYGDDPDNYTLTQKTDQYGVLNFRSIVLFNSRIWFLDGAGKGVVQYDGSTFSVQSNPVERYFQRMNLQVALTSAEMAHIKERNEVWTLIPLDDSTTNNCIVAYDYIAEAWTTYTGIDAYTLMTQYLNKPTRQPYFGGYSGLIRTMGVSLTTDTGTPINTKFKSRFVSNFGWSTTEMYRQLFLDIDPALSLDHDFSARFFVNQSTTAAYTTTIAGGTFQPRIDFGIPGKGLSVELETDASTPLRLNGFTIASRFQRDC